MTESKSLQDQTALIELRKHHFSQLDLAKEQGAEALAGAWDVALAELAEDPVTRARWASYVAGTSTKEAAKEAAILAFELGTNAQVHSVQVSACYQLHQLGFSEEGFRRLPAISAEESTAETLARLQINTAVRNEIGAAEVIRHLLGTADLAAEEWKKLANLADQIDMPDLAVDAYNRYFSKAKANVSDMARYISQLFRSHDIGRAHSVLTSLPEKMRAKTDMLAIEARIERARGNKARAREIYAVMLKRDDKMPMIWADLADLADKADLEKLSDRLEKLLSHEPQKGQADLWMALGRMRERMQRFDEAFEAFRTGNKLARDSWKKQGYEYRPPNSAAVRKLITKPFTSEMLGSATRRVQRMDEPQPILIVGMPRSGTSLLERVVSAMDDVSAGGEKRELGTIALGNNQKLWRGHLPNLAELGPEDWQAMAQRYWAGNRPATRFETDKLPQNYINLGWALKMFPGAPIIHIHKDPRDQAWSLYKRPLKQSFIYATDLEHTAHAIVESLRYMTYWHQVAPGRILSIRYEDLVSETEKVSRKIAEFCDLEWSPKCLNPEQLSAPSFTTSVVQIREPISTKAIGQWKRYERHLAPLEKALEKQGWREQPS